MEWNRQTDLEHLNGYSKTMMVPVQIKDHNSQNKF
jgi:hypothetical protein